MEYSILSAQLLNWYDQHHRILPWRISPADYAVGKRPDPYQIWLSEIMLQQTQVATVIPYFNKFMHHWPDLATFAAAEAETIRQAWAGLGYYRRLDNAMACAKTLVKSYAGSFPTDSKELEALPGIGPYTAAAIRAIAFDKPCIVMDGNIERIVSRVFALQTPPKRNRKQLLTKAGRIWSAERSGDFAQSLMDLGAMICRPGKPICDECPISEHCEAHLQQIMEKIPSKEQKKAKPKKTGIVYILENHRSQIWLEKRPDKGLLASMTSFSGSDWTSLPAKIDIQPFDNGSFLGEVRHSFTHFDLSLTIFHMDAIETPSPPLSKARGWWCEKDKIEAQALPTLYKKAWKLYLARKIAQK